MSGGPYIVTVKERPTCPDGGTCHHSCGDECFRVQCCEPLSTFGDEWPDGAAPVRDLSRRAVPTLDEARKACLVLVRPHASEAAKGPAGSPVAGICLELMRRDWSGGSVGPLPDGTVIEVERVEWNALRGPDASPFVDLNVERFDARDRERIITAYNEVNR